MELKLATNKANHLCAVHGCRKPRGKGKGKFCCKCAQRIYRAKHPIKAAYQDLKSRARSRGKVFTITLEEFIQIVGLQRYIDHGGRERHMLHLDRIDDTKGYEVGNIQILTNGENRAKQTEEMRHRRGLAQNPNYKPPAKDEEEPF